MNATEALGWASSFILIITLAMQLRKQIRDRTAKGISKWLFAGQVVSELGFVVFSISLKNWVFAATNIFLLLENAVGLYLTQKFAKEDK